MDFFIRFVEDYFFSAHLLTEDHALKLKRIQSLEQADDDLENLKLGQERMPAFIQNSRAYLSSLISCLAHPAMSDSNATDSDRIEEFERDKLTVGGRARYLETILSLTQRLRVGTHAYFLDTPPTQRPNMSEMTGLEIDILMAHARIGRLAMSSLSGIPYVIPLPFLWHKCSLYLRLELEGRKGKVLQENNRVCFEVDWYTETLSDYSSIILEGKLTRVEDPEQASALIAAMNSKYLHLRKDRPNSVNPTLALYRLTPGNMSGRKKRCYFSPDRPTSGNG
jgi:nitroimidazol reductase NimA-like FMN-containing flavoprotein (pyridoxamine 5'-phosphate oxidase superfamily)